MVEEIYGGFNYAKVAEKLKDEVAPVREETVKVLDGKSIPPASAAELTASSLTRHSALILTVKATYNAAAAAGVRVRWLYSADNVNFDSPEDAEAAGNYETLTFTAGATRQRTMVIPFLQPYVKVQIINMDTSYPVMVSCWTTRLR